MDIRSLQSDSPASLKTCAAAVQVEWTLACHVRDRGFDSRRLRQYQLENVLSSSSGLGHLVLSQETGVQFPVGVPTVPVRSKWSMDAGFSTQRQRVRVSSPVPAEVAQW